MSVAAPQAIERIHRVAIAQIDASGRLRQVDLAHVQVIADSILAHRSKTESGLKQPITIRPAGEGAYKLVMGAHRLTACTRLGDAEVDCIISFMDEYQARLAEIDENLCRAELTMFDRAAFLAERGMVWRCLHPEMSKGKAGAKARWNHATENFSFASEIADKVGLDERSIRNDVKMWRALSEESRIGGGLAGMDTGDGAQQIGIDLAFLVDPERQIDQGGGSTGPAPATFWAISSSSNCLAACNSAP
jgi:ParB family chromosome partitioning protein